MEAGDVRGSGFVRAPDGSTSVSSPPYYEMEFKGIMYAPQYFHPDFRSHYQFAKSSAATSVEGLWNLYQLAKQSLALPGEFFECGVHAGGSALFLARMIEGSGKTLHLFDTFTGMPATDPVRDVCVGGEFADAPIEKVMAYVGHEDATVFHKGLIPETFAGLEDVKIALAYVDVDIYRSIMDCCEFIYPRLVNGGVMLIDDYARPSCPGAREAVDEYFADKKSVPLMVDAHQAVVFKI